MGLILSVLLIGCQSIAYYSQAVGGQTDIWLKQRDIEAVLADPDIDSTIKTRLQTAQQARAFASNVLKLPENRSYSRYANLGRDYVAWNVVATPRYSVDAVKSCFPIIGCVSYRGYYQKEAALKHARSKKQAGLDVYVGGVTAYSTLGWFDDPLINTMFTRSEVATVGLIFHELAHQQVFIKGDTKFNESFATAVEQLGLRQWAADKEASNVPDEYFANKQKRKMIVNLVLNAREQMREAYQDNQSAGEDRLAMVKREQFDKLKDQYAALKQVGKGTPGFDRFFASELNNASLALFGEYHGWVAAFERLFEISGEDWEVFYKAVGMLSQQPEVQRIQRFKMLSDPGFPVLFPAY
jgi:predicted aminopeptidase